MAPINVMAKGAFGEMLSKSHPAIAGEGIESMFAINETFPLARAKLSLPTVSNMKEFIAGTHKP
jgi:hypothetical protein